MRKKHIFISALALWESTPEGAAIVKAERVRNTDTGNPIHP